MVRLDIKPVLSERDMDILRKRYHFREEDRRELVKTYELLMPSVRAEGCYEICKAEEIPGVEYECYAAVAITLSEYVDRQIAGMNDCGNIFGAYQADCIALELLRTAYQQMTEKIYCTTGLWTAGYDFPGDKYPLDIITEILKHFPEFPVRLNAAGMMVPVKSVAYIAKLQEERCSGHICENCKNRNCENRAQEKGMQQQGLELNYGYQRIFGNKEHFDAK